jgi:subtilase family serine protease
MGTVRRTSVVAVGAATLACMGSVAAATGAQAAASGRDTLAGSMLPAVARQHPAGPVAKSAKVGFELVLKLRDAAGARALVRSVSTPGSASYRHYVSTAQWEARFSPTAGQVASARNWLHSEGFRVGAVSRDRITISASGTAAQVEKAFGTGLENYKVAGHMVRLATGKLSMPASIAGSVAGAMGINQSVATAAVASGSASTAGTAASKPAAKSPFPPAPPAFVTAKPCGSYYNADVTTVKPAFGHGYPTKAPYEVCGYKPGQYRSAYGVGSATGKGSTVAIIDAYGSATIAADATQYFKANDSGNPFSNAGFKQSDATPFNHEAECAASSWLTEQAIDVESVHSTAPNAHILYVGAKNCLDTGLFAAEQKVIDNKMANVITNSWADTGGDLLTDVATKTAYDDLFMMADSTGITVQFSTGDDGDDFNLLGFSSANYPSESPYVTGVGGTSLQIGSKGQVLGDLGWATGRSWKCTANAEGAFPGCTAKTVGTWLPVGYDGGSGGFTSYNYTQPTYQAGVVPASLALRNEAIDGTSPMRVIPDISLDADPSTGFLIGLHQTFASGAKYSQTRYGGTSLASPLLAGIVADADQMASKPVGFINPAIYKLHSTAGAISDVVPGGLQGQLRADHAYSFVSGAKGLFYQFRELTYEGTITYCDETGNCASRPNTLSTAKGYDSMTGLGSTGPKFIADLAGS